MKKLSVGTNFRTRKINTSDLHIKPQIKRFYFVT